MDAIVEVDETESELREEIFATMLDHSVERDRERDYRIWLMCYCRLVHLAHAVQSINCVQLCNPTDCSMSGFPVLHYLLAFAQIYVHSVSDDIQPFHSPSPSSPDFSLSQNQGLFQ